MDQLGDNDMYIYQNAAGAARVPRDVPVQRDVHRLEPVAAVRRPLPHPRARRQLPAAAGLHRPTGRDRNAHIRMPQVRLEIAHFEPSEATLTWLLVQYVYIKLC